MLLHGKRVSLLMSVCKNICLQTKDENSHIQAAQLVNIYVTFPKQLSGLQQNTNDIELQRYIYCQTPWHHLSSSEVTSYRFSFFTDTETYGCQANMGGYQYTCQHQKDSYINVNSSMTPLSYSTKQRTLDCFQQI